MSLAENAATLDEMPLVGIVGGIGPLASAEFVSGIYRDADAATEQMMPRLILWSDPSFPDRTLNLLAGNGDELAARLEHAARALVDLGVSEILICCFTLHGVIGQLPKALTDRIVSLLDLTFESLVSVDEPQLLLCTSGSRELEVFERHEAWGQSQSRVIRPTRAEQERIHDLIYRLKLGHSRTVIAGEVEDILAAHGVRRFVSGCTELHLLADAFSGDLGIGVDALEIARSRILAGRSLRSEPVPLVQQ
ncbi:aspartate/glutamate racemase family protein [Microbacterium lacticum]|uniref:Aspartate racemase n=1 Tax=Microbacterium lacticum TaxID=33885 RepID=A0A4Y3UN55_9MICO|nr:aspartate/glutamate racemase family protein [Microbacterium lacticum]TQM90253.1 aspartate racemase [Microbacterium lacticum]GEB95147.1 aspartate racemase [Microbacterium lacticum]GGN21789.1 aspartate racemase [Microbacterium lacticum]